MNRRLLVSLTLSFVILVTVVHAATTPPAGPIPSGLPARLTLGLLENASETWMKGSGIPWDLRYTSFATGWANDWGHTGYDGALAARYFAECDATNTIPAIQFDQMKSEDGGGDSAFYAKTKHPGTMRGYFSDFKLLMERAKDFNKPVVVMVETDGFALLAKQSARKPDAEAAIKSSGVAELEELPNTVAGWGLSFLQIRKAVGASKVMLGMHVSGWASGKDVLYASMTEPLQNAVDTAYQFLGPLGLASNVTGETYDFLVGDPLDRGLDLEPKDRDKGRWLDAADSAPIESRSFNRMAEWMRLWNQKSGRRWLLTQVPLSGKDGFETYLFGPGSAAHRDRFASSGLFGVLFAAAADAPKSEVETAKRLLQNRVGDFFTGGGLVLPGNRVEPVVSEPVALPGHHQRSGATAAGAGAEPTAPRGSATTFDFERDAEGWTSSAAPIKSVTRSTEQKFAGQSALAIAYSGSGTANALVANLTVTPGKTVTFHIYVPAKSGVQWVQPYVLQGESAKFAWSSTFKKVSDLKSNAWSTLTVQVPQDVTNPVELGVQLDVKGSGSIYVDSVSYDGAGPAAAAAPAAVATPDAPKPRKSGPFDFEHDTEGWGGTGAPITNVAASSVQKLVGKGSLAISYSGTGTANARVSNLTVAPGKTITFHVYVPAKGAVQWVQPYVLQGESANFAWTSAFKKVSDLKTDAWNTLTVQVPKDVTNPVEIGVQIEVKGSGSLHVDNVTFESGAGAPKPRKGGPYDFEHDTEGWGGTGAPITKVAASSVQKLVGKGSLAISYSGKGTANARVSNLTVTPGKTITFHIYVPAKNDVQWVQPYVLQGESAKFAWTSAFKKVSDLKTDAWNTLTVQVPKDVTNPVELGVQIDVKGSGSLYVDNVTYE